MRPILLALVASLILLAPPALAREVTPEDRAAVQAQVDAFSGMVRRNDWSGMLAFTPPRIVTALAARHGVDEAQLRAAMDQLRDVVSAEVKIADFGMDVGTAQAATTPSGRDYLLLPTHTTMVRDGETTTVHSVSLSLEDEGRWRLMRVQDAEQLTLLRQEFPDFAEIDFPEAVTKTD